MATHYFMPMAGNGTRFQSGDDQVFKPFYKVDSLFLFQYGLKIIHSEKFNSQIHFIIKEQDDLDFNVKETLLEHYPLCNVHILASPTRGALETLYLGVKMSGIDKTDSVVSLDCDIFFQEEEFSTQMLDSFGQRKNILPYFKAKSCEHSFITIQNQHVTDIREKISISNNAVIGCYGFYNCGEFLSSAYYVLGDRDRMDHGEFYISTLVKFMLTKGEDFTTFYVEDFFNLGTPKRIEEAKSTSKWNRELF